MGNPFPITNDSLRLTCIRSSASRGALGLRRRPREHLLALVLFTLSLSIHPFGRYIFASSCSRSGFSVPIPLSFFCVRGCLSAFGTCSISLTIVHAGIHHYLVKHSYGNARSDDLWEALGSSTGKDVASIMHVWTRKVRSIASCVVLVSIFVLVMASIHSTQECDHSEARSSWLQSRRVGLSLGHSLSSTAKKDDSTRTLCPDYLG